jgi:hypothetical protein
MTRRRADDCHDNYQRPTPTPAAEVIAVHNYSGLRTIRALCPYCGQTHLHPSPATNPEPGVFTAACGRGDCQSVPDCADGVSPASAWVSSSAACSLVAL